ncbi:MAG: hypothetical protein IKS07_00870 [Lachnospiraceae bacterium]|nr:hypothetical protein [Lachnospiraceae bacterium]
MDTQIKPFINRNALKYIAIVAMLIDHIGWTFVATNSVLGQVMHFVGRLTGPIMAYMLYEGYLHTRSVKKYALRLGIFALISWVPYSLHEFGSWPGPNLGVIWTLFLALLVLWMWDKAEFKKGTKVFLVVLACILSLFGDWPIFDILWPLLLFIHRDDPKTGWRKFTIVIIAEVALFAVMDILAGDYTGWLFQLGAFLVPPIIRFLYNGEPGSKNAFHKWFFYVFYPLHLLILFLLDVYVF